MLSVRGLRSLSSTTNLFWKNRYLSKYFYFLYNLFSTRSSKFFTDLTYAELFCSADSIFSVNYSLILYYCRFYFDSGKGSVKFEVCLKLSGLDLNHASCWPGTSCLMSFSMPILTKPFLMMYRP